MVELTPSARLRPSPYYDSTMAAGASSFTVYNGMMMPTGYGAPEEEYWRLLNGVSQWDVAVERQVEITGPDAAILAQALVPRDLAKCKQGQGRYVPICDHRGVILNDPILLKIDEDHFWLSIADSNMWFWARAIAAERQLNVTVRDPDVSPMAVQGPKAEEVIASIFGDWVRELKRFAFLEADVEGIPVYIARSGWSGQGGFEIYLCDEQRGGLLWDIVAEAGKPFDIGPGNPNWAERVESGLLSYGGDTDATTNPFEVRMNRFVDLDVPDDVVGIEALRQIAEDGPTRHQLGIFLDAELPMSAPFNWLPILNDGRWVGSLTTCAWSYRLKRNIGFALVETGSVAGDSVVVVQDGEGVDGQLTDLPFA